MVYWYEDDGSQKEFMKPNLTLITEAQANAILNPPPTVAQQIATLKAQIDAMDGGGVARALRGGLIALLPATDPNLPALQALEAAIVATGLRAQINVLQATLTAATTTTTPGAN